MAIAVETTPHVLTEQEIAHRKACDYLKGLIMGSVGHISKRYGNPEFEEGCKDSNSFNLFQFPHGPHGRLYWGTHVIHVLHNRLRHNKPHTASVERDQSFLDAVKEDYQGGRKLKALQERVKEVTGYDLEV